MAPCYRPTGVRQLGRRSREAVRRGWGAAAAAGTPGWVGRSGRGEVGGVRQPRRRGGQPASGSWGWGSGARPRWPAWDGAPNRSVVRGARAARSGDGGRGGGL